MSSLISEYQVSISIFFWLNFAEPILRKIAKDAGFNEIFVPEPTLGPGIELRISLQKQIAVYKRVKISWNNIKYMLNIEGPLSEVVEAFKLIKESFTKHRYDLEKTCHYYEITFPPQPVDFDNYITVLRNKVKFDLKVDGEILKPFRISLSNTEEPINNDQFYRWTHITIDPDVNAPQNRVFLGIIKRETDFNKALRFLESITSIINNLKESIS